MDKYNISGILRTYSEKCALAKDDKQLKQILHDLQEDLKEETKNAVRNKRKPDTAD